MFVYRRMLSNTVFYRIAHVWWLLVCICMYMYISRDICSYAYIYIYIYIYIMYMYICICIYTHIHMYAYRRVISNIAFDGIAYVRWLLARKCIYV